MSRWVVVLLAVASAVVLGWSQPGAEGVGTLIVIGRGFEHGGGQAGVNLLREQDFDDREPFRQAYAQIVESKAELRFPDLPFGDYALILFHDENGNGEVDRYFFGVPKESLAFSNGFELGLTTGMPTFQKLRVRFDQNSGPFTITFD